MAEVPPLMTRKEFCIFTGVMGGLMTATVTGLVADLIYLQKLVDEQPPQSARRGFLRSSLRRRKR